MTLSPLDLGLVSIDPDHEFGPSPIVALVVPPRQRFRDLWRGFDDDLLSGDGCPSAPDAAADHGFAPGAGGCPLTRGRHGVCRGRRGSFFLPTFDPVIRIAESR